MYQFNPLNVQFRSTSQEGIHKQVYFSESSIGEHLSHDVLFVQRAIENPQQDKVLLEARQRAAEALKRVSDTPSEDPDSRVVTHDVSDEEDAIDVASESDGPDISDLDDSDLFNDKEVIRNEEADSDDPDFMPSKKKCATLKNKKQCSFGSGWKPSADCKENVLIDAKDRIMVMSFKIIYIN